MNEPPALRAVIVDDEESSHIILNYLLQTHHPEVTVVGQAYDVSEGVAVITEAQPDVIFLDIEMPDGSGFDLLQQFPAQSFHVIFVTGIRENDYAIRAFRFGALDFLLKPVDIDQLAVALDRAHRSDSPEVLNEQVTIARETNSSPEQLPSRIAIPTAEVIHFCKVKDIIWLEADRNYTTFHVRGAKRPIVASRNLGEYEKQFEPYTAFFRVHKSYIVNLEQVDKYMKGDAVVILNGNKELPVSPKKRDELIERLKKI